MNLLAVTDQIWFKFFYEQFGWKWDVSDTLIQIGNFSIKWYGVLIAVGFLLALLYAFRRASDFGIISFTLKKNDIHSSSNESFSSK